MNTCSYNIKWICLICAFVVMLATVSVNAQSLNDTTRLMDVTQPVVQSVDSINKNSNSLDTSNLTLGAPTANIDSLLMARKSIREEKVKKDKLESYFFNDSLLIRPIITWTINPYINAPIWKEVDTLLSNNRTELPYYKQDVGVTYLGTTGSAAQLHNYFKREHNPVFTFFDPYHVYTNQVNTVQFYSTKGPYTQLSYHTSGSKRTSEDNLSLLFTRNILPELNFGIAYDKLGSKGEYMNQTTKNKTFRAFSSYTGKRYVAHGGYIYNGIKNRENGGIANDFFVLDTVLRAGEIETKLKSAQNKYSSNTFFLTHSYGLPLNLFKKTADSLTIDAGTMVYFGHSIAWTNYKRIYTDGISDTAYLDFTESADTYKQYYTHYYFSPYRSYDSTAASELDNKVFLRLQPYAPTAIISKIDAGIGYSRQQYYLFEQENYLTKNQPQKNNMVYLYGNGMGVLGKYFEWKAFLKYTISKFRQNDLYFDAQARLSFYPIKGGIHLLGRFLLDNHDQTTYTQHYLSNHVQWNQTFDKTTENRIELSLDIPLWRTKLDFNNALVSKPIYYDLRAIPQQSADVLNITSIGIDKKIQWHKFHLDTRLLMQVSSNQDIMPLPLVSTNAALYFETDWVKSVLRNQIGLDLYYHTKFYDYAYNPASGMFHVQNELKTGSYPWIDLFLNFKWKRATIYVKMTNVGEGLVGSKSTFTALHYPRNNRMLRWGLNWHFHN